MIISWKFVVFMAFNHTPDDIFVGESDIGKYTCESDSGNSTVTLECKSNLINAYIMDKLINL